jgi:hypothetical protein
MSSFPRMTRVPIAALPQLAGQEALTKPAAIGLKRICDAVANRQMFVVQPQITSFQR